MTRKRVDEAHVCSRTLEEEGGGGTIHSGTRVPELINMETQIRGADSPALGRLWPLSIEVLTKPPPQRDPKKIPTTIELAGGKSRKGHDRCVGHAYYW